MSLRFIYGRGGSGKSYRCLDEIKHNIENNIDQKLILIVPEQFSFSAENNLLNHVGPKGVFKSEVLSFKRFSRRVLSKQGGTLHKRLNDSGKAMILYSILQELKNDLKAFFRASTKPGFIDLIGDIIIEFKRYNITPELIKSTYEVLNEDKIDLKNKLEDIYKMYMLFEETLHKRYIDAEDELALAYMKMDESDLFTNAEVWIDEFASFTPQQYDIIYKIMKKANRVNITITTDENEFSQIDGEDLFSECKTTEARILKLAQEGNVALDKPLSLNEECCKRFLNDELSHTENNFFRYPYVPYKKEINNIKIYRAKNNYEELEWIARDITSLVRDKGYRYKDIAVVCRDLENYEKIAAVIFNEYNVPYFLDEKRDITDNPLIISILSLFEIHKKKWSYESVFKYIKSGLINYDKYAIDKLENYVLAYGIKGYKWSEFWEYGKSKDGDNTEYIRDVINPINETKDFIIEPINMFLNKVTKESSVRDICTYIYEFLLDIHAFETIDNWIEEFNKCGEREKANEYDQIINMVLKVLDQIVEIFGEEVISMDKFLDILMVGFSKQQMGLIPVALDQVIVGDLARIKSHDIRTLYIIGVNDGVFPRATKDEGILSDIERQELKGLGVVLGSDTRTKAFEENYLIYSTLTMASENLILTYPLADFEGKSLRPSVLISRFKKIFYNLREEMDISLDKDMYTLEKVVAPEPTFNELISVMRTYYDAKEDVNDVWSQVYNWYKKQDVWSDKAEIVLKGLSYNNQVAQIKNEKIKALYKKPYNFDVSRIERYAACPFAFYIQYGLKARDRKIYEFGNPDFGSFIHDILDKFSKKVREENKNWHELDKKWCDENIDDIVNKTIEDESILKSTARYNYMTRKMKKLLSKSVSIISEHFKRGNFEVLDTEIIFGEGKYNPITLSLPDGEKINLRGRIDRVDVLEHNGETYIRVVDYKSGNKSFNLDEVYYGLQLQLLVYLDAIISNEDTLLKNNAIPGAILYFRIDDPMINSSRKLSEEEMREELLKKLKMNGLLLNDSKIILEMDKDISGYSLIIPAYMGKNGLSEKSSSVATKEQFNILREYVRETIIRLCEEMLNGDITIKPVKNGAYSTCDYCSFFSVCQFDTTIKNNDYNCIIKKKEKVWELIEESLNKKEGNMDGDKMD